MRCPVCENSKLEWVQYEAVRVRKCPHCNGHAIHEWKLRGIERNPETTPSDLKAETKAEFKGSTEKKIQCPKCYRLMEKRHIPIPAISLHLDVCERCEMIWLDGGELALFQLIYEASEKCQDVREFQRRINEVLSSPERKAELDKAISKATGPIWGGSQILEDILDGMLWAMIERGLSDR